MIKNKGGIIAALCEASSAEN